MYAKNFQKLRPSPAGLDLPDHFVLLTMHRPENVDDPVKLKLLRKASFGGGLQRGIPNASKNSSQYEKV